MKLAAYFAPETENAAEVVARMVRAQCLSPDRECRTFAVSGGALGFVAGPETSVGVSLVRQSEAGNLLLVSGMPNILDGDLDSRLDEIVGDAASAASKLAELDGAFAALFWDAAAGRLLAVSDALGIQPLYCCRQGRSLLLSTDLKAMPASGLVDVKPDLAGWGAFVSLGFTIGNRTQLDGVEVLPSATQMTYDASSGSLDARSYWSLPDPRPDMQLDDVDTGDMLDAVRREVRGYLSHGGASTVLMSGGLDSRLILALLAEAEADCRIATLEHPLQGFGMDGVLAARVARQLGYRHVEKVRPSRDFYLSPDYLRYLVAQEVAIPSMRLYISTHLWENLRPEMTAVWDGLGPGFAFAPAFPAPGGFAVYRARRCRPKESEHWRAVFSLFSPEVGAGMYEQFEELLEREIDRFGDDDFGTARFQMDTQMRRFLGLNPMTVYSDVVVPFTPALSKDLWNVAGSIPLHILAGKGLYLRLFEKHFPELLRIPICTGGNLVMHDGVDVSLWLRDRLSRLSGGGRYYWGRLPRLPIVGPMMRGLGLVRRPREERNHLMDAVLRSVSPDDPALNAQVVRKLQSAESPYTWDIRLGRRMLFYWHMWRSIMSGDLTASNVATFPNGPGEGGSR